MAHDTSSHLSPADAASLRRQLTEAEENLRLVEERKSQYVMDVEIPLQLVKQEQTLQEEIATLKNRLAGAGAEPITQPAPAPVPERHPNPFTDVVAIRDPARFVGREGTLERLLRVLERGSIALVGERKIGKSSLLHRLANTLRGHVGAGLTPTQSVPAKVVVFWDFFDLGDKARLLAKAIRELGADGETWEDFKRAIHGRRVVVLLDEFDLAPERGFDLDHLRGCRALCQAERGLRLVTASRVLPKAIFPDPGKGSWPYDFLSPQTLGYFTPDEGCRLLAHPWAPDALQFDAPTCEELIGLSGCHPYRLQRAAHHRYEALGDPTYDWRAGYELDMEALQ